MKHLLIAMVLISGILLSAVAQENGQFFESARIQKDLALTDTEVKNLRELWDSSQNAIKVINADRDVKASELKRLLVETKVDMNAVQKTLREAMDLEYKLRLAQIERTVKARDILGEERWARLQRYLRDLKGRARINGTRRWRDGKEPGPSVPRRPAR